MDKINKINISAFIVWLFTISGLLGILSSYQDWFLQNTFLNLFVFFLILFINTSNKNRNVLYAFAIPFVLGFVAEGLGANYGYIFGSYNYGENLGFKIWNVPLIICLNWIILTVVTRDFVSRFIKHKILICIAAALLMTVLDVIIEVSAPRFDYWEFENGIVPVQNYVGWFLVGFLAQLGYSFFKVETNKKISLHLFLAIILFFSVFVVA